MYLRATILTGHMRLKNRSTNPSLRSDQPQRDPHPDIQPVGEHRVEEIEDDDIEEDLDQSVEEFDE